MEAQLRRYWRREPILALCKQLEMPGEAAAILADCLDTADPSEIEDAFPGLFSPDTGHASSKRIGEWGQANRGLNALAVYLAAALHTRELYAGRGIPEEIYVDTMKAFARFTGEHRESYGDYGFDRGSWTYRQLGAVLFRLGALEFEMVRLSEDDLAALKLPAKPGAPVLSVHIPSDAVMTREALDRSYAMAGEFFARRFPDFPYELAYCATWLLAPTLRDLLKPGSRILEFQADYDLVSLLKERESCIGWVFKREYDNYEDLPEDTSLMRGIKSRLLSGQMIGGACGIVRGLRRKEDR